MKTLKKLTEILTFAPEPINIPLQGMPVYDKVTQSLFSILDRIDSEKETGKINAFVRAYGNILEYSHQREIFTSEEIRDFRGYLRNCLRSHKYYN